MGGVAAKGDFGALESTSGALPEVAAPPVPLLLSVVLSGVGGVDEDGSLAPQSGTRHSRTLPVRQRHRRFADHRRVVMGLMTHLSFLGTLMLPTACRDFPADVDRPAEAIAIIQDMLFRMAVPKGAQPKPASSAAHVSSVDRNRADVCHRRATKRRCRLSARHGTAWLRHQPKRLAVREPGSPAPQGVGPHVLSLSFLRRN
jgi:hypothetical protein